VYRRAAEDLLMRGERPEEISLVTLLRWIAQERGLLFHGSGRGDLERLEPIRLTRDASAFGDQQAVFASNDPVWAIYFATLQRGGGLRGTRNVSYGLGEDLYPRWYYFSHNEGADDRGRFGAGWLYVLSRTPFVREPPIWHLLDAGQWASPTPVIAEARVEVTAQDFPFADNVFPHRLDERVVTTLVRAARLGHRRRRGSRGERTGP
jgi:hypothetical protein